MSDNVIDFNRPKSRPVAALKVAEQTSPPKLTEAKNRREFVAALSLIWAEPRNWRTSRQGNKYIEISDLNLCVVITHDEQGYRWEIRWRYGNDPLVSKWIYVSELFAIDEAWDALVLVA